MWIHASAGKPTRREKLFFEQSKYIADYVPDMELLPYGAIIGEVSLIQIVDTTWLIQNMEHFPEVSWDRELALDDFGPSRFAWQLAAPEPFEKLIPIKGRLGLWEY